MKLGWEGLCPKKEGKVYVKGIVPCMKHKAIFLSVLQS